MELIIVLEEMGRSLLCAPFFSTAVLATSTLLLSNDEAAQSEYLPKIASGELTATLALTEENGRWDETGVTAEATADGDGWVINGAKHYVLDGHTAGLLLVAARTAAGVSVFAVDGDAAGVERTPLATMDQTRKQAKITLSNTCLLYTSPSPRDLSTSRMPSPA